jgi:hypothetical protein
MTMIDAVLGHDRATTPVAARRLNLKTSYWMVSSICLGAFVWVAIIAAIASMF